MNNHCQLDHCQLDQRLRQSLVPLLACLLLPLMVASPLLVQQTHAQDQITVRDPRTGKLSRFEALITEWDARELAYRSNSRGTTMPASRVVNVMYPRSEAQLVADGQFSEGKLPQAWQSYENAMADEPRQWVRREMLARQLRCAIALNRQTDALRTFFVIQRETPQSRYFHLVPVNWQQIRTEASLVKPLSEWLATGTAIQQLIAASWLLLSDEDNATATLKELAGNEDSRVAHLATAQLWRTRSIAAGESDLQRWTTAMERMPANLQAGPRFLIAQVRKRLAQDPASAESAPEKLDQAIVALLQIPILFSEHYQLVGSALLQAHQMLTIAGRTDEAAIVLSELKKDFGFSDAAMTMGARIENMDQ